MNSFNAKRVGITAVFIISALTVGAAANEAATEKPKGDNQGYHCDDRYACKAWRGGVYHRSESGVNYYYGGGEELGYGNKPKKIHYKLQHDFQYNDEYEDPIYYQDY